MFYYKVLFLIGLPSPLLPNMFFEMFLFDELSKETKLMVSTFANINPYPANYNIVVVCSSALRFHSRIRVKR